VVVVVVVVVLYIASELFGMCSLFGLLRYHSRFMTNSSASCFCLLHLSLQSDIVFACDVAQHLQALLSCRCFAQHPALHYVP